MEYPPLADMIGERHRIIANDRQAADMSQLAGRLLLRATDILDQIDFSPDVFGAAPGECRGQERPMSEDAEPVRAEVLREGKQNHTGATITLEGEFDMTGTDRFWVFVTQALAEDPRAITVDASGLEFIDSLGLLALLRARDAAVGAGVAFRVSDPSPSLRRLVEVTGVKDLLADQ